MERTNGNRVSTEVEILKQGDERVERTNHWLRRAGEACTPAGYEYIGSAAVHYYKNRFQERNFSTACQTLVSNVEEGFCDVGWKKLREALMSAFGREEKKRT